jgi:hypothetical protein
VCFAIADELVLDCAPNLAHGDVVLLGDVLKLTGDRAKDPGEDNTLCTLPSKVVDRWGIREDGVGDAVGL